MFQIIIEYTAQTPFWFVIYPLRLRTKLNMPAFGLASGEGSFCALRVEICHQSVGSSCARVEIGRDDLNLSKYTKRLLELSKRDVRRYVLDENLHEHANEQGYHQCHCRPCMMIDTL